jgi:hypothetical protein
MKGSHAINARHHTSFRAKPADASSSRLAPARPLRPARFAGTSRSACAARYSAASSGFRSMNLSSLRFPSGSSFCGSAIPGCALQDSAHLARHSRSPQSGGTLPERILIGLLCVDRPSRKHQDGANRENSRFHIGRGVCQEASPAVAAAVNKGSLNAACPFRIATNGFAKRWQPGTGLCVPND